MFKCLLLCLPLVLAFEIAFAEEGLRLLHPMGCRAAKAFVDENRYIDFRDDDGSVDRAYLFPLNVCDGVPPFTVIATNDRNCAVGCGNSGNDSGISHGGH